MSKEFEEQVLNKLNDVTKEVRVLSNKMENTQKEVKVLSNKMENTQKEVKVLSNQIENIQEKVNDLTNKFTVFDYEINNKIDTLFDAFTVNREKDLVHEKDIDSLEKKVFNHDIRISYLEDKAMLA